MREYEVVYIFRPDLESEDVDDRLDSFHDRLDGEVTALEHWGQRELAYEIGGQRRGYYVVVQFRAEPASLEGFEQALEVDEDLLRHLLVVSEGELPVPPSQRREEEDEEEDEEDEETEDDEEGEEGEDEEEEEGEVEDEGEEDEDEARDDGGDERPEDEEGDDEDDDEDDEEDDEDGDGPDEESAEESDDGEER